MAGGEVEDGLGVAGWIRVEVGAAADDRRAHPHRVPQHRQTVRPGGAGQHPGHRHRAQLREPAQGVAGLQDRLKGAQPVHPADADMGAQRGRPVAELEQRGLDGAALDVPGGVRDRARHVGRKGGVAVGVGFGGGGQQQIAAEVQPGAGDEAARRAHGLDPPAAEPDVHGAPVGEPDAAEHQSGGLGGRAAVPGRLLRLLRLLALGHRTPGIRRAYAGRTGARDGCVTRCGGGDARAPRVRAEHARGRATSNAPGTRRMRAQPRSRGCEPKPRTRWGRLRGGAE